jgi:hypothetical protein
MKKIFCFLFTISICHVMYGQGNVGIGTITPAYKLQVKTGDGYGISHTNGTIDVATYVDNASGFIGTKSNHPFQLYANDGYNQFVLTPTGNVGIGTYPTAQLHLANSVTNRKIVLYDELGNNNQFFGFGISWGILRYHVNDPLNDHVFFAGSSDSTANELMRIKGTGQVGIGVTTPQNRLDLHFDGNPRSGTHSTG